MLLVRRHGMLLRSSPYMPFDCTYTPRQNISIKLKLEQSLPHVVVRQSILSCLLAEVCRFKNIHYAEVARDIKNNAHTSSANSISHRSRFVTSQTVVQKGAWGGDTCSHFFGVSSINCCCCECYISTDDNVMYRYSSTCFILYHPLNKCTRCMSFLVLCLMPCSHLSGADTAA